ncbi:unnamed protein product [Clavelina lepadiformis]|uniref:Fucosyltransferase n=1 Tax=Clavelina lepadiformis TaxID=159417 RepID=A0ABP0FGC0_CLALP
MIRPSVEPQNHRIKDECSPSDEHSAANRFDNRSCVAKHSAGLQVDCFGRCFKENSQSNAIGFFYKFYFSFENAQYCKDYVTEKFWNNAINSDQVPVVWGPSKEDITALAPEGSFIHVDDFKSPSSLAEYLMYLDSNDTAYREYFRWREEPTSKKNQELLRKFDDINDVGLCKKVLSNFEPALVESVSNFMFEKESHKECLQN